MVKGVVFDVFGTLVEIIDKRRPFVTLVAKIKQQNPTAALDGAYVMSNPVGFAELANEFGVGLTPDELSALNADLAAELKSVKLFPEVLDVLQELRRSGVKIGLCSNLAKPYGPAVRALLPFDLDAYSWSYEAGAVKPMTAIYTDVLEKMMLSPEVVLFVGDTYAADYKGPLAAGMRALLLSRDNMPGKPGTIATLSEIFNHAAIRKLR